MRAAILLSSSLVILACSNDSTDSTLPHPRTDVISIVPGASTKGPRAYSPDTIWISKAVQTTFKWTNKDYTKHSLTGVFFEGLPVDIAVGDSINYDVSTSFTGSWEYHCAIHPSMVGRVIITP